MITTTLSRPSNELTNRLGYGATWNVPLTSNWTTRTYVMLFKVYFSYYFRVFWRSGIIHTNHLFFNAFFDSKRFLTLPLLRGEEHVKKYYRLVRLRYSTRFRNKRFYFMRKYLNYLHMSEFFFYRLGAYILIVVFFHIPEPMKRFGFLRDLKSRNKIVSAVTTPPTYYLNPRLFMNFYIDNELTF